jgi:hypothetical protein
MHLKYLFMRYYPNGNLSSGYLSEAAFTDTALLVISVLARVTSGIPCSGLSERYHHNSLDYWKLLMNIVCSR